ncbi:MAG: NTP transferase domain-containing protein [Chloroflexi bacterium]|nr:NTP transferase domain-containing protein [Chloroflexota bacterium]
MDAVVTAGGIPQPNEPLYEYSKGGSKALIDIAGKPMIQWVLDALSEAKTIERVVVIGLIPSITGEMVDWVVNTCAETKDDLYYNVVRREDMETRFPGSKRTYTPLKELEVCGGDMNVVRASIVNQNSEFWNKLIEARKNPAAQAALIGPDIIFKFIFRQLTIDNVIQRVADKLGLKGRAIVCPFAEVGMDVDKPHQLDLMRADLQKRARKAAKVLKPAIGKPVTKSKPAKTAAASKAKPAGKIKRK